MLVDSGDNGCGYGDGDGAFDMNGYVRHIRQIGQDWISERRLAADARPKQAAIIALGRRVVSGSFADAPV
jgi:hypothetical protein